MGQIWEYVVAAANRTGAALLDEQEFNRLVNAIHRRYLMSPASSWWWSSLRVPSATWEYGHRDGLALLMSVLPKQNDVVLVVTDESARPSGAVRGSADQLHDLIANCPFFEFAIVPVNLDWILFDTHHNAFVAAGRLEHLRFLDAIP